MGTRATIQFKDEYEEYYVYAGSSGSPENVIPDIESVIKKKKDSWSGSECGSLVSCFLGETYDTDRRIPFYEMTAGWHGDESYMYLVEWNADGKHQWTVRIER
ncbi:MAG: hypothetical protein QM500_19795 [Methylococcales bacterium]